MNTPVTADPYTVAAVASALDLLEVLSQDQELSLEQVSRRAGLTKSRSFRLLYTLAQRGYVERAAKAGWYRLGARMSANGSGLAPNLRQAVLLAMRKLRDRFNETVNLGILEGEEIVYVEILESQRPFRTCARVGSRLRAHTTALGKALLASETQESREALITNLHLSAGRRLRLVEEMAHITRLGFAVDAEENEPGVRCLAVPIRDPHGAAVCAVSVSGPVHRIHAQQRDILRALLDTTRQISAATAC